MVMRIFLIVSLLFLPGAIFGSDYPLAFVDSSDTEIIIDSRPKRVVSLVPSITEMLLAIGAEDTIVGRTYHSVLPHQVAAKPVVGGFFRPDLRRAAAFEPDLVFYSTIQQQVGHAFADDVTLINLSADSIAESFEHIRLLGRIFDRQAQAEALIAEQQRLLDLIEAKTDPVPAAQRPRVVRLMGRDSVMAPGDDSFQNEYIRRAGGIPPTFGLNGSVGEVDLADWQAFNPQVIYGCGGDRDLLSVLEQPGWKDVEAVRNQRIIFFPCDLTCRVATHSGDFVAWLAARLHQERFSDVSLQLYADRVVSRKFFELPYEYVDSAQLVESDIRDFRNKSVLIEFDRPMTVLSTLEGWRDNIRFVGNHYFPPPAWGLGHRQGLDGLRSHTLAALVLPPSETALLFTGADMDNLAIVSHSYRDMEITALVTAGVRGNAVRMAIDEGLYYGLGDGSGDNQSGTINIMIVTNTTLSPRAMSRALISATEAKTAALLDLDIRSSASGMVNPATGTGTDNILVVQGSGPAIDATGGHTRMGELIGRAVYDGVHEAVLKQNCLIARRPVFQRLGERGISLREIDGQCGSDSTGQAGLEHLLLEPRYESFINSALVISDAHERGLVGDLSSFTDWCQGIADEIAGKPVVFAPIDDNTLPETIRLAFGALTSGLCAHTAVSR
jgi:iron complex transport system substrate-binding protein